LEEGGPSTPESKLEYVSNCEYVTPPEADSNQDRLLPLKDCLDLPPTELVVYTPDNEGSLSEEGVILAVEEIRDGEFMYLVCLDRTSSLRVF